MHDIIIIGGGPAGLSAAITARQRGKSALIISNRQEDSGLYKAREVGNYPGFPGISGPELLSKLTEHALGSGAELITAKVNTILPVGGMFNVAHGTEIQTAKCIVIATGVTQTAFFPGEAELLGKGVSYCATCDGMLFRKKKVCAVCLTPESFDEAEYLKSIGCEVVTLETKNIKINGTSHVTSVTADSEEIECSGVFIMRKAIAPHLLLPGLQTEDGHVCMDSTGATNVPGVYAAGDCVGTPYQISKAVGEGLVAALSAAEYIDRIEKSQ